MREIKFRGKDVKTGKWVFGYYAKLNIPITDPHDKVVGWKRCPSIWNDEPGSRKQGSYWRSVAPETVGQYIGRMDVNGVEIYEGDILECSDDSTITCIVKYKDDFAEFILLFDASCVIDEFDDTSYIVIGNIYDNPELDVSRKEAEK